MLRSLKGQPTRIHSAQQLAVNHELVQLYWQIGRDILERQAQEGGGLRSSNGWRRICAPPPRK